MPQLNAYDVEWLLMRREIVYADSPTSAARIVAQKVNKANGDKLLSVCLKNVPIVNVKVEGPSEARAPG